MLPSNVADDKGLARRRLVHRALHRTTRAKDFVVRGIYEGSPFYPLLGTASISQEAFDDLYERPRNRFTLLNVAERRRRRPRRASRSALEDFPDTRIQTRSEWIDKEDQEIQQFLLLLYVLLALSVIISLFGMVNTLALSVFERTRELGNAARRRDDAAPDATDDPARERDHGADRGGARAPARDLPRRARDARARASTTSASSCRSTS